MLISNLFSGFTSDGYLRRLNKNFTAMAPELLYFWENPQNTKFASDIFLKKTFNSSHFNHDSRNLLGIAKSDARFGYPIHKLVETISDHTDVFYYLTKSDFVERFKKFQNLMNFCYRKRARKRR
jgi:hypothetical protein